MKDQEKPKGQSKKVYSQPQLQVYGDLRNITQTLGMSGAMDKPTKSAVDKTSA
jgi:hypothetical protein